MNRDYWTILRSLAADYEKHGDATRTAPFKAALPEITLALIELNERIENLASVATARNEWRERLEALERATKTIFEVLETVD